ncbi:vitamin K-dependent protein C-like [Ixodes scapularis]|uniref:vitamin K-dependent protein C-like n=1 Tax=Ixodes scapularis TaxID=6945 RepID=UPI001A9E4EBE|nr:vitamin K-dependent protein C-like [Ixodes scapularis]
MGKVLVAINPRNLALTSDLQPKVAPYMYTINWWFLENGGRLHPKIVATYGAVHSASQQALTTNIKSVAYHPQFSEKTFFNDIAILKTAEEIQLSAVVRPICINLDPADWTGKEVTVAGWGIQKPGRKTRVWTLFYAEMKPSEKLRYTKLTVLSQAECKTKLKLYNFDENTMICAFQEDTDACKGDSGSGLTHSNGRQVTQIAIVSHGVGCAEGLPGVYTSVHKFKEWIRSTVEGDKGFKDLSN